MKNLLLLILLFSMQTYANNFSFPFENSSPCASTRKCLEIVSVSQKYADAVYCEGHDGTVFNCNNLYRTSGEEILGHSFIVATLYTDGCHVPGACGQRACHPANAIATFQLCSIK